MINHFSLFCSKSACTVRHQSNILSVSDSRAEVRNWMLAEVAAFLFALRSVARNNHISHLHSTDSRPNTFDNGCGLVTDNDRPQAFSIKSIELIDVCMTESIRDNFYSNFSSFGRVYPDLLNDKRLFGLVSNCSFTQNWLWLMHFANIL